MEAGKLTIPDIDEKVIERLLKPTYRDKKKAQDAVMHLYNIPYQDIKKAILDYMFQTTSCFHPLWNIERVKTLMEEELEKSIIVASDPMYRSYYISEFSDIFEEFTVWHRLTPDQFLNIHMVKGAEYFNEQNKKEQLKLIKEIEEEYNIILQPLTDFSEPAPKQYLKTLSHKDRQILLNKKKIFYRVTKLQEHKK